MAQRTVNGRHPMALQAEAKARMKAAGTLPHKSTEERPPAPPPPPPSPPKATKPAPVVAKGLSPREKLEALPDKDVKKLGAHFKVEDGLSRAEMIDALLSKGAKG